MVVQVGTLRERVSFGTEVTVEGKLVMLVPARERNQLGAERLRDWRSSVLGGEDAGLSRALGQGSLRHRRCSPADSDGTGGVRRIGPMKLERWGDEILAALE